MPKKFLTAESATFKVLPADTGIAKSVDDPMGVKGLNPFHDLMAGFVKVDAEGNPYTVGVLPDTVSILGSDTILIAEDPSDTFTFSIPTTATPQLAGVGIGTPGVADAIVGNNAQYISGFDIYANTLSAGGGLVAVDGSGNFSAGNGAVSVDATGAASLGGPSLTIGPIAAPTGETYRVVIDDGGLVTSEAIPSTTTLPGLAIGDAIEVDDAITFGSGGGLITRDSGDLTLSTTTSGSPTILGADGVVIGQSNKPIFVNSAADDWGSVYGIVNVRATGGTPGLIIAEDEETENFSGAGLAVGMRSGQSIAAYFRNSDTTGNANFVQVKFKSFESAILSAIGIFEFQNSGDGDGKAWFGVNFDGGNTDLIRFHSTGDIDATGSVSASGGYIANGETGLDTTITTGSLVGKTITITKGLITGFA